MDAKVVVVVVVVTRYALVVLNATRRTAMIICI